jgi:hypothetical protein
MSRSKHTEAQIIGALKQVEAGRATEDVAREQSAACATPVLAYDYAYIRSARSSVKKMSPLKVARYAPNYAVVDLGQYVQLRSG